MNHTLRNGYSVSTRKVGDAGATEFTTHNPAGEVISTVVQSREAARETIINMRVARCLRRSA